jgi:hypothetical protein
MVWREMFDPRINSIQLSETDFNFQNKINWFILSKHNINHHQNPSMVTYFGLSLDQPQANVYLQKALSVLTIHCGIPYCLQDVRKNVYKRV